MLTHPSRLHHAVATWRLTRRAFVGCCIGLAWSALLSTACGLGTYEDTGSPEPGQWWPWVCPDTGEAAPEAGCGPKDSSGEAACEASKDGQCK